MRRFAMPAFLLAGLFGMPTAPVRASQLCVGVTVVVFGTGQTNPVCVEQGLVPVVCHAADGDLTPYAYVRVVACLPVPV